MAEDVKTKDVTGEPPEVTYTRREALAAMARYSAAVGGTAATIVTADGLVSAASAYPPWLSDFCRRRPTHWLCTWDGWNRLDTLDGNGRGNGNGRIRF